MKSEIVVNEYFTKFMGDERVLVTTRHGSWCELNRKEYKSLQRHEFGDKRLFEKLKEIGIIIDPKNIGYIVRALGMMYREQDMHNFTCVVNLTNRCNLSCAYCLADSNTDDDADMSVETMHALVDFINGSPWVSIDIEFQGGESLMRFDLLKVFVELIEKKLDPAKELRHMTIVTNLALLDDEIADYLALKNFHVGSSLDGPKELHDSHRSFADGRGSYEIVMAMRNKLKSRGLHVGFSPTITNKSIESGARAIIDEYINIGMEYILFRPIIACGRGAESDGLMMKPKDFFEFWKDGLDYMVELEGRGVHVCEKKIKYMLKNIFTPSRSYMCMRRPCGASISQASFMPDGSIYACDSGKRIKALNIGNFVNDEYKDMLLNSLQLRTMTSEAQPLCDTCVYTAFCGTCISRVFANWSDSVARTPRDFDCIVYKMMFDYIFGKMNDKNYMRVFKRWSGKNM